MNLELEFWHDMAGELQDELVASEARYAGLIAEVRTVMELRSRKRALATEREERALNADEVQT